MSIVADRPKTIFYKSTGEALGRKDGDDDQRGKGLSPDAILTYVGKLERLVQQQAEFGIEGIVAISGAGNIIRGDTLKATGLGDRFADMAGRLATIQNILIIADALESRGVPHELMIAPSMRLTDEATGEIPPYTHERLDKATEEGKLVLIGGGKGTDGNTTDGAVMWYAGEYGRHAASKDAVVLKGTTVNGVFTGDPKKRFDVSRYTHISAADVLRMSTRPVDEESLVFAMKYGLDMILYEEAAHDITEVLDPSANIGTIVHGTDHEPIFE